MTLRAAARNLGYGVSMVIALLMTLVAGGATSIGAAIGLLGGGRNSRFLAMSLGLSAGVMLYVSFVEILPSAAEALAAAGPGSGWTLAGAGFVGGMLVVALIDRLLPSADEPADVPAQDSAQEPAADPVANPAQDSAQDSTRDSMRGPTQNEESQQRAKLYRSGLLLAVVLAVHNIPEGLASFMTALEDPTVALPIVLAIALHNIPEGMAVAVPVLHATGSRSRAFWLATLSGLAEPAGAVAGYLVLAPVLTGGAMGAVLAAVAGVMVFVTVDKLLPAIESFGEHRAAMSSMIVGMALMSGTLAVLG